MRLSDGGFGDGLLESFHIVRDPKGGMFVNFFARKAFRYRVLGLKDQARLVVDFEPTGKDLKFLYPRGASIRSSSNRVREPRSPTPSP